MARRKAGEIADQLLLLEHPPVITVGRGGSLEHLLSSPEELRSEGVEFHRSGRGGEVTYHGPGQLVAYPILLLEPERRDLHRYLRSLEQVIMEVCASWGLRGERSEGRTGVWVEGRKVASIGVRASSWVVSHGVSINYGEDLSGFERIVPCGLTGVEMTSLSQLLPTPVLRSELEERFCRAFEREFLRELIEV